MILTFAVYATHAAPDDPLSALVAAASVDQTPHRVGHEVRRFLIGEEHEPYGARLGGGGGKFAGQRQERGDTRGIVVSGRNVSTGIVMSADDDDLFRNRRSLAFGFQVKAVMPAGLERLCSISPAPSS